MQEKNTQKKIKIVFIEEDVELRELITEYKRNFLERCLWARIIGTLRGKKIVK